MKKIASFAAAIVLAAMTTSVSAFAADSVTVNVTINTGKDSIMLIRDNVDVTDIDSDGKLTINDALYCAHENGYDGGAAAGYKSEKSQWGLSLQKLWGIENGGSYGYYVNDGMAMSLEDELSDGDELYAYVYSDTKTFKDTYSYFDIKDATVDQGKSIDFTLSKIAFDANYQPVVQPVEGAVISLNGVKTDFVTDKDGKATVKFAESGDYVVTAQSESELLASPVAVIVVDPVTPDTSDSQPETDSSTAPEDSSTNASESTADSSKAGTSESKSDSSKTADSSKAASADNKGGTNNAAGTAAGGGSDANTANASTGSSSLGLMIAGTAALAAAAVVAHKKNDK